MVHLPYLQPFWDVNKRTARLAANIPLFRENLVPLSFLDVPPDLYHDAIIVVYEMNRLELLRDIFEWAYRRSCDQYQVIRKSAGDPPPTPDPIRLRYRKTLERAVQAIVGAAAEPNADPLRDFAREHDVEPEHVELFVARAVELLRSLNQGSAGRYGIGPEAFGRWREQIAGADKGSAA